MSTATDPKATATAPAAEILAAADLPALTAQWRARCEADVLAVHVHRAVVDPQVTVVIIAYRSGPDLLDALRCVREARWPAATAVQILVADCGGVAHLRPDLAELADVVLELTPDIGLNPARNCSLAWAEGDLVALLDDDGEVADDYGVKLLAAFADPAVVAVRGKIIFKRHRYFTTLGSHYDRGPQIMDDTLSVEGHMAIYRAAYYLSGGFGDRFYGGEGAWLTLALHKTFASGRVIYAPDVVMRHDFFQSWGHFYRKSISYANILDKVAAQEPEAVEFQRFMRAEFAKRKPRGQMRADERVAWLGLCALRFVIQKVVPAARAVQGDRSAASPRR